MSELFEAGLTITAIGMSVVFILLTLMVFVIRAMSRLSRLFDGGPPSAPAAPGVTAVDDTELVSVIAAAIHTHRAHQGR